MTWIKFVEKFFNLKYVGYFQGTMGRPELAIPGSYIGIVCEVKICFYLHFFSCLFLSVFWRIIITIFFHCLFVDGVRIMPKILRFNMIITKYNMVHSVNNVASTQVQLGLSVGEIYVVNILKVKKIPILKFQKACVRVIWPLRIIFFGILLEVIHCAPDFYEYFMLH